MSEVDLQEWAVKTQETLDKVFRNIVTGLADRVMVRTPYGRPELWTHPVPKDYTPGHLRKNWQLGIDAEPEVEIAGVDKEGSETMSEIILKAKGLKIGQTAYLTNTAPYAFCIEYTGYSSQVPAGAGMARAGVKDTFGALEQILSTIQ